MFCIWFELDWQKSRGKEYSVVLKYSKFNFRTVVGHTIDLYDGFESHLDGWSVLYHGNLMSDNFHKTADLKKRRIVNLSLTGLYSQLMGAAPVPKFVRSLALDFPDICPQFFLGNFSRQKGKKITHNTIYFHAVAYPSRWPPKPWFDLAPSFQ